MKVIEARVAHPINAKGGLYVEIEGTQEEIYKGASDRLAVRTANRQGWEGSGQATIGMPVRKGVNLYTRAYWFHEKRKLAFQ
ncbi:hypothetical protein [Ferviditalea candida]|uniref:Uncharacterized protein n=1 Tax=Ferviditalea candida TaxID=3108399 RepID=A0ABU5ZK42_9BACL|nr:hypothetical protein [Paenibacillaceae bacterium T2]